jgi:hypothetical protein
MMLLLWMSWLTLVLLLSLLNLKSESFFGLQVDQFFKISLGTTELACPGATSGARGRYRPAPQLRPSFFASRYLSLPNAEDLPAKFLSQLPVYTNPYFSVPKLGDLMPPGWHGRDDVIIWL